MVNVELYKDRDYLIKEYQTKTIKNISKNLNIPYTTLQYWMKKFGIITKQHYKKLKKGDIKIKRGYRFIFDPNHQHAHKDGWVYEHVHILIENNVELPKNFNTHHIDGNKLNNDINNLYICSIAEHTTLHRSMEKIVFELYKKGMVEFKNGAYISRKI